MVLRHVVVDGSNIATEGRDAPSLSQLDEAVQAFIREFQPEIITVVVDATFPNRIARSERRAYEDAVAAGEVVSPPAGAVGRGDAFVLQIADRSGGTVLSNDSFQEFHGTYPWLFEEGRLIGGKPVPHVGWVFMTRAPVRGPASRRAISAAKRAQAAIAGNPAAAPAATPPSPSGPAAPEAPAPGRTTRSRAAKAAKADKAAKASKGGDAAAPAKAGKAGKASRTGDDTAPAKAGKGGKGGDGGAPAKAGRSGRGSKGGDGGAPAKAAQAGQASRAGDGGTPAKATNAGKAGDGGAPAKAAKAGKAATSGQARAAKKARAAKAAAPARDAPPSKAGKAKKSSKAAKAGKATKAGKAAAKATEPAPSADGREKAGKGEPTVAYNDALPFIEFVGAHPVGSRVEAVVEEFSSHGAYVQIDGVRAYAPLKYLGDPPPRTAKAVLRLGESRQFVVIDIDASRRGVDVALPGIGPAPAVARLRSAATKKGGGNVAAAIRRVLGR